MLIFFTYGQKFHPKKTIYWVLGDTQIQIQKKLKKNFKRKFLKKSEIFRPKNFKNLLISIPKCIVFLIQTQIDYLRFTTRDMRNTRNMSL